MQSQPVLDPVALEFVPSVDHATVSNGTPVVTKYVLEVYVEGAPTPFHTIDLGKPNPGSNGLIRYDFPNASSTWPLPGGTYQFRVKVVGPGGSAQSAPSGPFTFSAPLTDAQRPSIPTAVSATPSSSSAISLAWTRATDNVGVTGYRVYRGGSRIGETANASYVNSGLTAATTYTYTVTAVDAAGNESLPSTAVSATTLPAADTQRPTVPTNLTATPSSSTAITLAWTRATDNIGVTGYRVYRGGTRIGETANASYVNSGLTAATTYTYTVTAVDAAGNESLPSTAVSARTSATQPDLLTGLQGYWTLDQGAGTTAADSSGKGNSGTLRRGATWTAGRLGGGLQLDGIDDHVTVPHSSALSIGGTKLTLSAWIRFAPTGTWQTVVAKVAADSTHTPPYFTYSLGVTGTNRARMFVGVGGAKTTVDVVSQQKLVTGNWYHLTGVYDGAQLKIYVNGVRDATRAESRSLTQRTSSVRIGAGGGVKVPLKGVVDEVRIYGRALSDPEITALYQYTGAAAAASSLMITVTAQDADGSEPPSSMAVAESMPTTTQSEVRWSEPIAIAGAPAVTTTVTGDFNGDGVDDIAAFEGGKHGGPKLFAWFEAPGFVKHSLNTRFATGEFIGSAAVADLNNDERPDIVFSMDHHSGKTQEGWVYWAENPGGDATGEWPIHLVQKFPSGTEQIKDMAIDDVDGDGRVDVVVRHRGANQVRILFQNASPSSWTLVSLAVRAGEGLSIGDLDGDGGKDLLLNGFWLAAPSNPRTGEWLGFPIDPTFYKRQSSGVDNAAKTGVGDIDGDGRLDAVISTAEGATGRMAWYRNPLNPRTAGWPATLLEPSTTGMPQAELGDIDLDGYLDVMSGSAFGQKGVYVYLFREGSFEKRTVTSTQGLHSGKLADLDGDGDLDIVGATTYGGALYVYLNTLDK